MIGLEARLKCKAESDWKIMEWITEPASETPNRGQVRKDGRTAYIIPSTAGTAPTLSCRLANKWWPNHRGSQVPKEVVFEGTMGVRDMGWY